MEIFRNFQYKFFTSRRPLVTSYGIFDTRFDCFIFSYPKKSFSQRSFQESFDQFKNFICLSRPLARFVIPIRKCSKFFLNKVSFDRGISWKICTFQVSKFLINSTIFCYNFQDSKLLIWYFDQNFINSLRTDAPACSMVLLSFKNKIVWSTFRCISCSNRHFHHTTWIKWE